MDHMGTTTMTVTIMVQEALIEEALVAWVGKPTLLFLLPLLNQSFLYAPKIINGVCLGLWNKNNHRRESMTFFERGNSIISIQSPLANIDF